KKLTTGEAALLAGIPKGPSYFSPYIDKHRSINRQRLILTEMKKQHRISKKEYTLSLQETLPIQPFTQEKDKTIAPYFQDEVKKVLRTKAHISNDMIEKGGLRVYTT